MAARPPKRRYGWVPGSEPVTEPDNGSETPWMRTETWRCKNCGLYTTVTGGYGVFALLRSYPMACTSCSYLMHKVTQ